MNNVIKASILAMFWLVISSSAYGLSSTCDFNSNIRSAWHLINMNWYESAISNVLEMQTNLAGAANKSISNTFRDVGFVALQMWNPPLPHGKYAMGGTARLYVYELEEWELYSGSKCLITFDFPEPEECPKDPIYSNQNSLSLDIQNDLQRQIGTGACLSNASFSANGTIQSYDMAQECCDVTRFNHFYSGAVEIGLSGIGCTVKSPALRIPQIATTIKANFTISGSGSGKISSNSPEDICEDYRLAVITAGFTGTITGNANAIAEFLPPADIFSGKLTASGSTQFSLTFQTANLSNLGVQGCAGPIVASGSISVLPEGSEKLNFHSMTGKYLAQQFV